ncbi:uro-adherence factor A-like isoform X2 [Tenebrio molitor]|uniref:uro-adherence factor A-like isoform X2 n=1 Tax=Tenebrio molitor TaxID=7067 RepID=UPI003624957D
MPRRTPVRELQKEEPVVSSPLRRSSRISNANSPAPTKVIARRNSASEVSTPAAKVTRGRRSSLSQPSESSDDGPADNKKVLSTIKTRRGSLSSNNEDDAQKETIEKLKTRSSSAPKEQPQEVKKNSRLRKSISEDAEGKDNEPVKKATRSRTSSLTKKSDVNGTESNLKNVDSRNVVLASTPVKKSPSSDSVNVTLESIEEDNKENDSPTATDSKVHSIKKKKSEIPKIDFDLSIINEASLTEEETSPQKKSNSISENQIDNKEELQIKQAPEENNVPSALQVESAETATKDVEESAKVASNVASSKNKIDLEKSLDNLQESDSETQKVGISTVKNADGDASELGTSENSFRLQLSSSVVESDDEKSLVQKDDCEPMDVDVDPIEVQEKLEVAKKVTDEVAEGLREEIQLKTTLTPEQNKEDTYADKITDEVEKAGENLENESTEFNVENKERNNKHDISVDEQISQVEPAEGTEENKTTELGCDNMSRSEETKAGETLLSPTKDLIKSPKKAGETLLSPTKNLMKSPKKAGETLVSPTKNLIKSPSKVDENKSLIRETKTPRQKDMPQLSSEGATASLDFSDKDDFQIDSPSNDITLSLEPDEVPPSNKTEELAKEISSTTKTDNDKMKHKLEDVAEPKSLSDHSEPTSNRDEASLSEKMLVEENNPSGTSEIQEDLVEKVNRPDVLQETQLENVEEKQGTQKSTDEQNVLKVEESSKVIDKTDVCDTIELSSVLEISETELSITTGVTGQNTPRNHNKPRLLVASSGSKNTNGHEDNEIEIDVEISDCDEASDEKHEGSKQDIEINLCDTDSDKEEFVVAEGDVSYNSPVKRVRTKMHSMSDDEILATNKNTSKKTNTFDRSIDSKYSLIMLKDQLKEENSDSDSDEVVIELSDSERDGEVFTSNNDANVIKNVNSEVESDSQDNVNNRSIDRSIADPENETVDEKSIGQQKLKRRSQNKSIVLTETIKAGEDEKRLSGQIHKVVDLFCAGITNKSDVSINVSLEYIGQLSDTETDNAERTESVEISLSADVLDKEAEPQRGSKRRKICHDASYTLELSQQSEEGENAEQSPQNIQKKSPKGSLPVAKEKNSPCKKRKSLVSMESDDVSQESPRKKENSPNKKRKNQSEDEENSVEEEQVEQSDDQETDNDVNLSSVGDCSVTLERIFSSSFDDYDENDITWKPDDEENSSCSEISTDDACEESDVEEETPDHVVVTTKMNKSFALDSSDSDEVRKKKVSPKKNQKHKVEEEEIPDDVVTATKGNKNTEVALNSCDNDEVMKKKVRRKKNRKHKLFHSSRHNIEEAFGAEESTENAQIKQKTDSKNESSHLKKEVKPDESQKKSLNKKQKQNFFSESDSIENMLPEISETRKDTIEKKKNRKRKHSKLVLLDEESDEMIVSKYLKKKVATNENVKSLSLKPSTKMSSGWSVKKMT